MSKTPKHECVQLYCCDKHHVSIRVKDCDICKLEEENKRLREALEFYSEDLHYRAGEFTNNDMQTFIEMDRGQRAKQALEQP